MSSRSLIVGLPLVAGSALILMALLSITLLEGGAFILDGGVKCLDKGK